MTRNPPPTAITRSLLDASTDPMACVAPDGRIVDVNLAAETATGLTREQLLGNALPLFFDNATEARAVLDEAFARGRASSRPLCLRHLNGGLTDVLFSAAVYLDDAGGVAGAFAVARDITEAKRAEQRLRATSHYARSLIEASLDPLVTISVDGKIMDVNRATEKATGLSRDVLIGSDFSDYFTEPEKAREGYRLVFSQGHVTDYPLALRHVSGEVIEVLYNASVYHDEDGHVAGAFAAARDVTLLKRSREELERTNQEIRLLSQMTDFLQSCQSVDESFPVLRTTMERLFPGSAGRCFLLKPSGHLLEEAAAWGDAGTVTQTITPQDCWALRRGHVHEVGCAEAIAPRCSHLPHEGRPYMCIPLLAQGSALGVILLIVADMDSSPARRQRCLALASATADSVSLALANLRLRESLHAMSIRDPLTGLYNRRFMDEALSRELSRAAREAKPLAVAMLDIDHFKQFNDSYGHDAGDVVLEEIGRLMTGFRQGSDLACRYGGEEFLLVLPGLSEPQAIKRLEALRASVSGLHLQHAGQALPGVSISIGLALSCESLASGASLIKAADQALYRAKENGRNRLEVAPGAPADTQASTGVHA